MEFDMAGPDGVGSSRSVTLEGRTLSGPATGPSIDSYRTAGGAYTQIYNDVGRRLGTTHEATILREIHRQYDAQMVGQNSAQTTATSIVNGARESSIFGDSINTEQIAAQIMEIRRDNPAQAAEIERQVYAQLSDTGDQSRLSQDISTAQGHIGAADARLTSLGSDAPQANGPVINRADLTARSNALIEASTDRVGPHRGNPRGSETLNVHELAYQVEQIAAENPRLAQVLRADLTTRLGAADAATFNRVLAGDTGFGEGIGRAFAHPVDGAIGAGKGIANGFIALGDLFARGSTMQAAADQQQAAAFASLFGNDAQAAAHQELAEGLNTVARSEMIPQIPYSNIAQSGGGDVGTAVDVAMAGKGILTGSARLLARNADEIAGVAGRTANALETYTARFPFIARADDVVVRTADDVNAPFVSLDRRPPYTAGSEALEFTTTEATRFVRVHGPDNMARSWMMQASDVQGLTAQQIKDKFALPELPTLISDVSVPTGTRVRVGEVAPQDGWGAGGATQFELLERLPESAFQNTRGL
jgi:hypothetical protein